MLIAQRDISAYLHGITGYIILAAILFLDGVFFNAFALGSGPRYSHEVLEQFFYFSSGTTMIASILISMRAIAEEASTGTDVLLRTSPASEGQVVLGKYLASMAVLALLTLLTLYMPMMILVNGHVSLAHIATGYLGLMLLGSATTAIGVFGSSLFKSQMAAAILSGVMVVTLLLLWLVSQLVDPPFADIFAAAALFDKHFSPFQEGRLLTSGLVYYASLTWGFLTLTTAVLHGRRWQ
ncbi:MAG: ABC transporter permease subunit [Deltaproteobacteria bacterium]|nr:ABC transporter permease subunit [Deltaproteobacteria bacterium]